MMTWETYILWQIVSGEMNKKILQWIVPSLALFVAAVFSVWSKRIIQNGYGNNLLSNVVYELTEGYQIRQLITALAVFLAGYILVACLLPYDFIVYIGLSFPTGIAIWNLVSIVVLVSNIKYSLLTMIVVIMGLLCAVMIWRKEHLKAISFWALVRHVMYIASLILVFSTGLVPIINTYDSHVFIYQFGEMLANEGAICFESVGACVAVTGINPALMVALARFSGFETIQIFHWMLIISLLICVFYNIKQEMVRQAESQKSIVMAILFCVFLLVTPSFLYLAHIVNACTYIMVYITIIVLYAWEFSKNNIDTGWILISLFIVCLSFGRLEGGVLAVFCIVCIGYLSVSKKSMMIIAIPSALLQIAYFIKILSEKKISVLSTRENFLSISAIVVIFLSMAAVVIYVLLYDKIWIKKIRERQIEIIMIGLLCACLAVGMYYSEKFVTNLMAVGHNLEIEYWKYFPHVAAIVLAGTIIYRKKVDWWDSVLFGYTLLNFAICLGRELPLREGFGDSYNRILCSLVPLTFYVMLKRIAEIKYLKPKR